MRSHFVENVIDMFGFIIVESCFKCWIIMGLIKKSLDEKKNDLSILGQ